MAASSTRQESRARLQAKFQAILDRVIPGDESLPLKGRTFREWEDQADELDRTVTAGFLEERAALEETAHLEQGGCCPHCGSEKVYLDKHLRKVEVQTPHGLVVLEQQTCRCRSCDRTFSPSGPGMGLADGRRPVAQSGPAGGAGGGESALS